MVIDTSGLIAVIANEPEQAVFVESMKKADKTLLSAASLVEANIVLMRGKVPNAASQLAAFLEEAEVEVVPVDEEQAQLAVEAYRRYGKGRHPARLNFGDCFVYALAKQRGEPLLFKGDDFSKTDLILA